METRYLQTLIKAAEVGSFSKASQELHITQSAASQRVKFLEDLFGHQLLDRSGQQLTLTEAGDIVVSHAREILKAEQNLRSDLDTLEGEKHISVGTTPTFGSAYLPQALNRFILKNADLADIKFNFGTPEQALLGLQKNEFDLAVLEHCDDLDLKDKSAFRLPNDELVFISAPELGIPEGTIDLELLLKFRIFVRKEGCSSRQLLRGNLTEAKYSLDDFASMVTSDDLRLTIKTVAAGSGVSFLSRSLAQEYLDEGTLNANHVNGMTHQRRRTMVVNVRREEDEILHQLMRCVLRVFPKEALTEIGYDDDKGLDSIRIN
jgi:DNA-binding transcriptional LysR family regulator